jgi:hypothetical protein
MGGELRNHAAQGEAGIDDSIKHAVSVEVRSAKIQDVDGANPVLPDCEIARMHHLLEEGPIHQGLAAGKRLAELQNPTPSRLTAPRKT